jgi:hypothetical protein
MDGYERCDDSHIHTELGSRSPLSSLRPSRCSACRRPSSRSPRRTQITPECSLLSAVAAAPVRCLPPQTEEHHQLNIIFDILGTPSRAEIGQMAHIPPAYAGVLERHCHEHPKPKINFYRKFPGDGALGCVPAVPQSIIIIMALY